MARPRKFDEVQVLDKAMMCFWEKGYEGASVSALELATGISRISLYNTFKDKEQLFIQVQNRYHLIAENYLTTLLSDQASMDTLEGFFQMLGNKSTGDDSTIQYGCMMVNTVLNVDSISHSVVENVKKYRSMMIRLFTEFLSDMQAKGKIHTGMNISDAASYLLGSMWGALAVNRLYSGPDETQAQINVVVKTIRSWRTE